MAQRSAHAENLFVVRWGSPEAADVDEIKRIVPSVKRSIGKDLVYIAIMPADLPNLDEEQRKLLMDLTESILPSCALLIIVMESRGFRGAILRSAMTAVTMLTRKHETMRVVDSVAAALETAANKLPVDRKLVERVFLDAGSQLDQVA
jgi:hypothetical protein